MLFSVHITSFFLNTVIIDDSEMGGIRLEWLKVKDSEELKQLGTFNEVRRQIKLMGENIFILPVVVGTN